MTQQNNWQQGVWGDGSTPAPNAYEQTYNAAAPAQPGAQAPQAGAAAPEQPAAQAPQPAPQPAQAAAPQPGFGAYPGAPQPAYAQPAYAPQPPAPAPKKGKGWIVALVAVVLFFALMFFGLASCTAAVSAVANPFGTLGEDLSSDSVTTNSVGIIEVSGTIQYDGTTASPEGLKAQLDRAEENPYIKAVVLRVDSGGGTATAGEEMAAYVRDFSKPVVVSSASMNASAAYEISSQADYIFTAKTTAIGAIGTAMQLTDISELLDKLGITVDNITSAESKDSSYGTRALTEDERAYYQAMVDQINTTFVETVAEGRGMTVDEVRALATGLTFTGMDAVENGLADEIGTLEDAVAKAGDLAGFAQCDTVYLRPSTSGLDDLLNLMSESRGSADARALAAALEEMENHVGFEG
ncbi:MULTISPECIES: signal peptide peptidase SppA [unclassified Adlercreutzia]|uniref:signal peptide peptidase SppA n=1 Tax=unclassified Adlercreutzia TaxID=2636013 RepID=UPI0013EADB1E|nr:MULTISPECIES: signal peptide peptidase SppA [unclassified Adlercreutzia]